MQKKGVNPKDVYKTSKENWLNASFRITVVEDDFEKVFSESFWPKGVRCREWLSSSPRAQQQTQQDEAPSPEHGVDDDGANSNGDVFMQDAAENTTDDGRNK